MTKSELLTYYGLIVVALVLIAVGAPIHPVFRALAWLLIFVTTLAVIVISNQEDGPDDVFAAAGNAIKDLLFGDARTEIVGVVSSKHSKGLVTDHPRFYIRVSDTGLEVSSRLYESADVGQQVVLTYRGESPITTPDELKSRSLISITPLKLLSSVSRDQWESDPPQTVHDIEKVHAGARAKTREARAKVEAEREREAQQEVDSVNQQLSNDICNALGRLGVTANPQAENHYLGLVMEVASKPMSKPNKLGRSVELVESPISDISFGYDPEHNRYREFCFVPDPRLNPHGDFVEVHSKLAKRHPIIGNFDHVRWKTGSPGIERYDLSDYEFSDSVAEYLGRQADIEESILASKLDIQVYLELSDTWTIMTRNAFIKDWRKVDLNCVIAVADSLLAMPLPVDGKPMNDQSP